MKKISIIVPCYNESGSLLELYKRTISVMQKMITYDYEIIFVDNASTDNSQDFYKQLAQKDPRVKALLMSRNFGTNQTSILAGLRYATGNASIIVAGDLQDPPELIPEFVKKWEQGFHITYGIAKKRKGSFFRKFFYAAFYRIFRFLSYLNIPLDSGDFSLLDEKVISIIKQLPEKDLYIRGLRTWVGFRQTGIDYVREDRHAGKTSLNFLNNFTWAKKAIVNFSYKPLEYISAIASLSVVITCGTIIMYLYWHFKYGAPRGFSTLLMVTLILGAVQLLALSIIGEYLIRIFQEVKGRPQYIIQEVIQEQPNTIPKNLENRSQIINL